MGVHIFRQYDRAALDREYDNQNKMRGFDFAGFLPDALAEGGFANFNIGPPLTPVSSSRSAAVH